MSKKGTNLVYEVLNKISINGSFLANNKKSDTEDSNYANLLERIKKYMRIEIDKIEKKIYFKK